MDTKEAAVRPALPEELDPTPWLAAPMPTDGEVAAALANDAPDEATLVALLRAAPDRWLEALAQRAATLTHRYFGRTIQLYAPLYLSNYCSGGCAYCGYASDRQICRQRLEPAQINAELCALKELGFEQVLLLTGERHQYADFNYLQAAVKLAAGMFHEVTVEAFPMSVAEYRLLAAAGCVGVTLYQETYDESSYRRFHRWGPKRDYTARLQGPARALAGGLAGVGLGALLGLADPLYEAVALFRHARYLQRRYWRGNVAISFPRLRPEAGGFQAPFAISGALLAQIIFAFRICLPETTLVLSTRECPAMRDGLVGVGINRMSAGSHTTVGGYGTVTTAASQFAVSDERSVAEFSAMLRRRGFDPVFKNWDAAYREVLVAP